MHRRQPWTLEYGSFKVGVVDMDTILEGSSGGRLPESLKYKIQLLFHLLDNKTQGALVRA